MTRETVDFGIDLGTTNSAVAQARGTGADVVRSNRQQEFTPSAVHVDGHGRVHVGDRAKERAESDPDNAVAEFKLRMGSQDHRMTFADAGREMSPEELSAEVLKSLRGNVRQATGEEIGAAVITVPAAFELDQCDATSRAASLAGLDHAPLLQEPTAAAWAYSMHDAPRRGFWLVYDFGGGTFDAALLKIEDGEFTVVNHAGDNFLGGKLIDWTLVDDVLIPAARSECGLTSLQRGDGRQRPNIAKLKGAAENAKIELSQSDTATVAVDLVDDEQRLTSLTCDITRADLDRAAMPLYRRSIALCRKALADHGMSAGDVERVLLVGGATLSPMLRELVADPTEGLGIQVDHRLNPVTVVACGAAMYAATRRIPRSARTRQVSDADQVVLDLAHSPAGPDTDPLIGGTVVGADGADWTGWTIELVNEDAAPAYRSGRLPVGENGAFTTRVRVGENAASTISIELRDPRGTVVPTVPSATTYQHRSLVGGAATLSHSVGVALSDNRVRWVLEKGTELPAEKTVTLRTTIDVRRSTDVGLIRVPIVEGERLSADRNRLVGELDVRATEVTRDVPTNSEVQVFVRVDESRLVSADAYVPLLDEEFPIQVDLGRGAAASLADLRQEWQAALARREDLGGQAAGVEAREPGYLLERFDAEGYPAVVEQLLTRAAIDGEALSVAENRIRDAQAALDEVEHALELPVFVEKVRRDQANVTHNVRTFGDQRDEVDLANASAALDEAIAASDRTLIERRLEHMIDLEDRVLKASGHFYPMVFAFFEDKLTGHPDPNVGRLLDEGRAAVARGDMASLSKLNQRLRAHLPAQDEAEMRGWSSTVTDEGRR